MSLWVSTFWGKCMYLLSAGELDKWNSKPNKNGKKQVKFSSCFWTKFNRDPFRKQIMNSMRRHKKKKKKVQFDHVSSRSV